MADLAISSPVEWMRLLVALGVFLAPGLAIADRVLPQRLHLLTAPIWSFSILPLVAILLDFALGIPINGWTTGLIAVAVTAWAGWPRARQAWAWATTRASSNASDRGVHLPTAGALVAIAGFLMLVHGLPHVPGDSDADVSQGPSDAYRALAQRAVDAVQGDHYPYPVHVDEHIHIAWIAQIQRQGTADIDDPYTGQQQTKDLFTVQGMRSERGFDVAIAQVAELTGMSLVAIARFLPAIWAGFLGITLWLTLRPAPGAMAGAALVAVLPSTARFLGVGFLVPSAFALPWFLLALLVAQRAHGAGRFFGLLLVVTAAHFMHLVFGVLAIAAAVVGTMMRDERPGTRASMALAALLPLVWILPATWSDARSAVGGGHTLPFATAIFAEPTMAFYVLAVVGAALAFAFPARHNQPHRALAVLAILMALSLALSIRFDHRNDATYSRQLFAFLVSLAALVSYALGDGARRLWVLATRWRVAAGKAPVGRTVDGAGYRGEPGGKVTANQKAALSGGEAMHGGPHDEARWSAAGDEAGHARWAGGAEADHARWADSEEADHARWAAHGHQTATGKVSHGHDAADLEGRHTGSARASAAADGGKKAYGVDGSQTANARAGQSATTADGSAADGWAGTDRREGADGEPAKENKISWTPPAWPRNVFVAIVVAFLLAAPLHHHLERPMYRVHDERSWQAAHVLEAHVGASDVFLSHPWQAPLYNSLTGAVPHTVLRPGSPPERGADWTFYLQSGGADEAWLAERGITVVVSAIPPNAPHRVLGADVYRLD